MKLLNIIDYQLYFRTIIVTLFTLCLFRVSASRLLGQFSPLDLIINILIGAVLGTAIVGGLSLLSSLISVGLITAIHRLMINLSLKYPVVERFIKGKKNLVISDGTFVDANLAKSKLHKGSCLASITL